LQLALCQLRRPSAPFFTPFPPFHLDSRPARELGPRVAVPPEHERSNDRSDEPEEHVDEVDPDGVLEPRDVVIAVWVLMDVDRGEDAEDSRPQDAANGMLANPLARISVCAIGTAINTTGSTYKRTRSQANAR